MQRIRPTSTAGLFNLDKIMEQKKNYKRTTVTAALPYANGGVHIGHLAGVYVPADIYVRYLRLKKQDVRFICGSDEHGVPITIRAKKEGITPQQVVDRYHAMIKKSFADFGISFDIYSRTTSDTHSKVASDFFKKLYEEGKLVEKTSMQYYDEEAHQFLADRYITGECPHCHNPKAYGDQCEKCGSDLDPTELINPKSAISGSQPVLKETKNWYLPLNEYQDWLKQWILEGHKEWRPNVYGQCKSWLDLDLQPRAMTRDLDWGIPVPVDGAEGKVLYVWFDAPIGYISNTQELMPEDWEENRKKAEEPVAAAADFDYPELTLRLREAEAKLSVWLDIVLDGVSEAGDELNRRVTFLLRTLEAPADEAKAFVDDFAGWLERMEYRHIEDFRSELQYRLALALDLEDEEDERSRLFLKLSNSLAKTRAQFARHFEGLISSHGELDDEFWEELEEIFIMADLGVEAAMELTERLRTRAREQKVTTSEGARELLREEIRSIFARPRHIVGITPPEVVLMIGVNGAGKTTTIAKLAYRDRMQGKKVMIAAADTFRAAAIEQLQVWANRVGALFHRVACRPRSISWTSLPRYAMS